MSFEFPLEVDEAALSALTERQRLLVRGAVLYNALIQPGRTLTYKVYLGGPWKYPRLTDISTLDGGLTHKAGLAPVCEFSFTSPVRAASEFSPHYYFDECPVVDRGVRYLGLTGDDAVDDDDAIGREYTSAERLYRSLEASCPLVLDDIRRLTRKKRTADSQRLIERKGEPDFSQASPRSGRPPEFIAPGKPEAGAPEAVIVAMHWLQPGGAERWAMETVRLVKEAGMVPIVITNIDGHQPWITDPLLADVPVINLSLPTQERPGDEPLLRALFEQFRVRGVLIHHSTWMYERLWWAKRYYPQVPVVDSLHILEFRWGGGFPARAVEYDDFIDVHHVISPQLVEWLTNTQQVSAAKVVDAPLAGLTAGSEEPTFKPRKANEPFTLAFVGRINRQKRPDAFILLAERLNRRLPGQCRFILHGNGDIDNVVSALLDAKGLRGVVEWRGGDVPVSKTYGQADVLVVSSVNEGITLTSFEALAAGVPVISTDVGSQRTVVPADALLPTSSRAFIAKAAPLVGRLLKSEEAREDLWGRELAMLKEFAELEPAGAYFARMLASWK